MLSSQTSFNISHSVFLGCNLTLIVKLFTFTKSDFDLCSAFEKINAEGYDCKTLLLDLRIKPFYFTLMKQKPFCS